MTEREFELYVEAIRYAYIMHQACPEVGWGPNYLSVATDIAESLSFPVSQGDIEIAAKRADRGR